MTPRPAPKPKSLGKKQIRWCRDHIRYNGAPIFAQMQDASRASKQGHMPIGGKAK